AKVIISDYDEAVLEAGKGALAENGMEAEGVVLGVTDSPAVGRAGKGANEPHRPVDILVANACIAWPDTPGESTPDDAWLKILDVDLNGAYWSCREFGRPMIERRRGSIVTMGSMSGLISNKPQRQVHYNVAKAGVHHMTRSLAGEWAERGVRVNAVAPTYVDTAMSRGGFTDPKMFPTWMEYTPMKREGRAGEIAYAILFLSSEASSAMTGSLLVVDCGYTIW